MSFLPVSGDRVQLQQVVLNLVMNAIEAMSTGGERPRELRITTGNVEDQVQVTVEDSGPGLDLNTMAKIFEPFYTTKSSGMGMGLSISSSIVQSHGGRLWATAKDGPGTAFHFTLVSDQEKESRARLAENGYPGSALGTGFQNWIRARRSARITILPTVC